MSEYFANFLSTRLNSWLADRGLAKASSSSTTPMPVGEDGTPARVFLHVGCGHARKSSAGPGFQTDDWQEIRLDIDRSVHPDIVGTMLDMSAVASGSVDAVYSSHSLEHLYAHEVALALIEMQRVLKPDGFLVITVPDLQSTAQMVAEDRLFETAYISPAGPITPFDILFGHRGMVAANGYMAHHSGFTLSTMMSLLKESGFGAVAGQRREAAFDLWVIAAMAPLPDAEMLALATLHLPN